MKTSWLFAVVLAGCCWAVAAGAETSGQISAQALAQIIPGHSTKAELRALLGAPWRVVQFDDCGETMPGQADETWEYRGTGPDGPFRLHVEFDERGVVHLIAEIPDKSGAAVAVAVPTDAAMCFSM
jgi:hypothetical protein